MNVTGITVENFEPYIDDVYKFCELMLSELVKRDGYEQTEKNLSLDWENEPSSLLRKLHKNMFYALSLVYDENKRVVAASAIDKFDDDTVVLLKRIGVIKEYRLKPVTSNYMLPQQIDWARDNGWKKVMVSFNKYNKMLSVLMKRMKQGKGVVTTHSKLFNKFEYIGLLNIQNTEQYTYEYVLD